jgi:hypothetical protein
MASGVSRSRRNKMNKLTQDRLKELLSYDPDTGIFVWIKSAGTARKGAVAGSIKKWGYVHISVDGVMHKAHRLAWFYVYGVWPNKDLDHKNRNSSDNRIDNLREATVLENAQNKSIQKNNASGIVGVSYSPSRELWRSQIWVNKKTIHLGTFKTKEDAIFARKSAEATYHPYRTQS